MDCQQPITGQQLIDLLSALPVEQRQLPVRVYYDCNCAFTVLYGIMAIDDEALKLQGSD